MPCNDVTESVRIVLDGSDRIKSYRLIKMTCGGAVGTESMLLERLRGKSIDEILRMEESDILISRIPVSDLEKFLTFKHFLAIRSVLEAYNGHRPAGAGDTCAVARINFDKRNTIIEAEIDIALLTDRIKACAHCGPG